MLLEERREEGGVLLRFLFRILGSRILSPPCFRVRVSYASWGLEFDHPRVLDFCHPRVSPTSYDSKCSEFHFQEPPIQNLEDAHSSPPTFFDPAPARPRKGEWEP